MTAFDFLGFAVNPAQRKRSNSYLDSPGLIFRPAYQCISNLIFKTLNLKNVEAVI